MDNLDLVLEQMESARDKQLVDYLFAKDYANIKIHSDLYTQKIFDDFVSTIDWSNYDIFNSAIPIHLVVCSKGLQTQENFDYFFSKNLVTLELLDLFSVEKYQTEENFDRFISLNPNHDNLCYIIAQVPNFQSTYYFHKAISHKFPEEYNIQWLKENCPKFQEWYNTTMIDI